MAVTRNYKPTNAVARAYYKSAPLAAILLVPDPSTTLPRVVDGIRKASRVCNKAQDEVVNHSPVILSQDGAWRAWRAWQ